MNEEKEVYFDQYCKSCKYHGLEESKDPCNDCLAEPSNTNSQAIIEAFNRAWLMHIHRNPHHWQHWVLINDEPKEGTILIEMPYPYIIEMICDWWAFSWIKGDLSEMFAWYKDHESYIKLHNNTRSIVEEILEMIRTKLTEVENAEN